MKDIVKDVEVQEFEWGKVVTIVFTNEAHIDVIAGSPSTRVSFFKPTDDDLRRIQHGLGEVK
jgi:hypothetical protein